MGWKQSLDRYLTSPPDDGFTDYFELVTEALTQEFFDANEDWVLDSKDFEKWVGKCFDKGYAPEKSALIIERAKKIYEQSK